MPSEDQVVPARRPTQGSVLPAVPPVPSLAAALGAARRGVTRRLHLVRHRPAPATDARMLVLVPAHDAEATIGRTLAALLTQTRTPERLVVLAEDCADRTEQIARRYRGVTVMRTVADGAHGGGALDEGWRRWQTGHDLVAVVDAGTVPAPDCLQRLEEELGRSARPGGVVARDTTRGPGVTHGGRGWLFDAAALHEVAGAHATRGPWAAAAGQGDAGLTVVLDAVGRRTLVSAAARTHTAPARPRRPRSAR